MSNIFSDDQTDQNEKELTRKAIAEAGGLAVGSGHQAKKEAEAKRRGEQVSDRNLSIITRLATAAEKAEFVALLNDFQIRLDQAFEELEDWRIENEQRTARLEDGTAIYRMEDGRFCTSDGRVIPQDQLPDNIPDNALTLEEHKAYLRRAKELAGLQDDIIKPGYDLAQDPDATAQDIKDFEAQIREANKIIENPASGPAEVSPHISADMPKDALFNNLPQPS